MCPQYPRSVLVERGQCYLGLEVNTVFLSCVLHHLPLCNNLVALVVEEKARQIAGDTDDAYGEMVDQARGATETLTQKKLSKNRLLLS